MNTPKNSPKLRMAIVFTGLIYICLVASGCDGAPTAAPAQTPEPIATTAATVGPSSAWKACEYDSNEKAYGSISDTTTLDRLDACYTYKNIVTNGYVATDKTGEARMRNNGCILYVFQEGNASVLSDILVSFCSEGSCQIQATGSCNLLTVVNIENTILTFVGTTATILNDYKYGVVLVMVSEGVVTVTPGDGSPPFDVHPNFAAYVVTPDKIDNAKTLFGFDPGIEVDFSQIAKPLEEMGFGPQTQRANLTLLRQQLPVIPITVPYQFEFHWIGANFDNPLISEAVAEIVDWNTLMQSYFPQGGLFFTTGGEEWDILRKFEYNPENAQMLLTEGGMTPGQEITIVYDESIPGLDIFAQYLANNLVNYGGLTATLKNTTPDDLQKLLPELKPESIPTLYLGGY